MQKNIKSQTRQWLNNVLPTKPLRIYRTFGSTPSTLGQNAKQMFITKYEEVSEDLYGYRANRRMIFYQVLPEEDILVIRILHQKMDLKSHLTNEFN